LPSDLSIRRTRALALIGALALAVALGGCGGSSSKSSSTVPTSTTAAVATTTTASATTTTTTTSAPSAADDLADYFAAATATDRLLRTGAAAVNGAIGKTQICVEQSTLDAIAAADPTAAAMKIPPGLAPSLLVPVLTVQSDLVSRYYSLRGLRIYLAPDGKPHAVPISDPQVHYALGCLGEGGPAAAAFSTDLARARTAAAGAPPVVAADPASRAAAELAVQLAHNVESNSGSLGCGGKRLTSLVPVTWHHTPPAQGETASWDGDVAGVAFDATYKAGQGWTVLFHAN
jgi:hypothetical protein